MATESFLQEFSVDKKSVKAFVKALESSKLPPRTFTKKVRELKKAEIKNFFKVEE
jgi:hypothetical protein